MCVHTLNMRYPLGCSPAHKPKSTPTFAPQLAIFLKSVAAHAHLCWVQPERRVGCNLTLPVRCPLPLDGTKAGGAISSLGHSGQSVLTPSRCCAMRQTHALEAECADPSWARSAALAQVAGTAAPIFVRGPIRLAPPQLYGSALFPGRTNVIMVHYRHPVEAFVSLYYCVSKPEVCPRRIPRRDANNSAPPAAAVDGVDGFLLDELAGLPSTELNLLLRARATFEPPSAVDRPFQSALPALCVARRPVRGPAAVPAQRAAMARRRAGAAAREPLRANGGRLCWLVAAALGRASLPASGEA